MTDTVKIKAWVRRGGMLYNTECLGCDDPMHPYNQVRSQGYRPEDYGIFNLLEEEFKDRDRHSLINEILRLRKKVDAYVYAGF